MYRLAQPHEFDRYSVAALMAVGNTADLQKLLALHPFSATFSYRSPPTHCGHWRPDNSITALAVLANRMLEPAQSPTAAVKIAEDVAQGNVTIAQLRHRRGPLPPAGWP